MSEQARIDKWLWAVRIYKTRSIAAEACKKGHIMIGERSVKPSHAVRVGDVVKVMVLDVDEKRHRIGLTMKNIPKE